MGIWLDNFQDCWSVRSKKRIIWSASELRWIWLAVDVPNIASQNDFKVFSGALQSVNYIAVNTKAIVISFVLYNQAGEVFIYNELLIEKSPSGLIVPNNMTIIPFRRSFRDSSSLRPQHAVYDVLRVICAVLLNIFVLYRVSYHS